MTTIQVTDVSAGAYVPVWVRVFHNNAAPKSFQRGFQPGDKVTEVFTYVALKDNSDDVGLVDQIFQLFNIGDDPTFGTPDEEAVAYHALGNRPLWTGDVVAINGSFYTYGADGPLQLDEQPPIRQHVTTGTVPLY